jgi:hypothetical protein
MLEQLQLIAGDPERKEGGATFSRFVLPFRYRLGTSPRPLSGPRWELDASLQDKTGRAYERLHYLTMETADVLFRRAAWFTLAGDEPKPFAIPSTHVPGGTVSVMTGQRRIVLFEYSAASPIVDQDPDLLRAGFLLIDLHFSEPVATAPVLDDLLQLNELFRYWRRPYYEHQLMSLGDLASSDEGDAAYHERWATLLNVPIVDDGKSFSLVPAAWQDEARASAADPLRMFGGAATKDQRSGWVTYGDNRTFVWTCAMLGEGLDTLRNTFAAPGAPAEAFGHWVKLLNVDLPGRTASDSHATRQFEREWARERTQKRWEETGTAYGFTTHSGAMLAAPSAKLPLVRHWADMYFDQTLLLLYVRVTTFRFSEALTAISADARDRPSNDWRHQFDRLRRDFALFTNLYQFPLVSNQQQGIELYAGARAGLDIKELFEEVQEEINSTHEYFELLDTRKQTTTTTVVSITGGIGLAFALAMTFLSMNTLRFTALELRPVKGTAGAPGEWLLFGATVSTVIVLLFGLAGSIWWIFFRTRRRR